VTALKVMILERSVVLGSMCERSSSSNW